MKLFDIMLIRYEVQGVQIEHYVEILSKPFEGLVNVRMIPNDPMTLKEVEVDVLSKPMRMPKWVQYAEVSGSLSFPTDMLRFDACFLRLDEDKFIVGRAVHKQKQEWTVARWRSFGWMLTPMKTLEMK